MVVSAMTVGQSLANRTIAKTKSDWSILRVTAQNLTSNSGWMKIMKNWVVITLPSALRMKPEEASRNRNT